MSLQVWLPLTSDLHNQGVSGLTPVQTTAPTWVDGKLGKAMSTGALYLPANDVAKFYNNNAMSFTFWVYAIGSSGSGVILGQEAMSVGNNRMFTIFQYPSPNDLHLSWQSNESSTTFLGSILYGVFPSDTWTHCAITYDGAKANIYINGEYQTSWNGVSTRTNFAYDVPIPSKSIRYLNDLRIYDHCLSQKEVKEISKGLVAHYKLDDWPTDNLAVNTNTNSINTNKFGYSELTGDSTRTIVYDNETPCVKITRNSTEHSGWAYLWYDSFRRNEIKTSTTYTVSMDVIASGSGSVGFNGFLNRNATNQLSDTTTVLQGEFNANGWSHLVFQTTTKSSFDGLTIGSQIVYMNCSFLNTVNVWLMMKNLKVEEGNKETYWTPSSTDTLYNQLGYNETVVYDSSGHNYHGKKIDTLTVSGDSARYFVSTVFDGISSGVLIENLPLSSIINSDITYAFWIKPDGDNGGRSIYFGSYSANSWSIEKTTSNILRLYWMGNPDEYCWGATISDGVWQHVVVTKHGTNDVKVYINGELKWTSTANHNELAFPTTYRIGRDYHSNDGTPYKGQMSDFRIYATALSADDIKELYQTSASIDKSGNMYAYELREV